MLVVIRSIFFCCRWLRGDKMALQKSTVPAKIELAVGMKVMVTSNVETDLDVTNGARGEIVEIILDPREPPVGDGAIVELKYLPVYILVRLQRTRASRLEGLEPLVIPVEPTTVTSQIKLEAKNGKTVTRSVKRRQYPITAAYAFTDYRSQGQTITLVLVDIASPPSGTLSLFNLYVALSCSSGRSTIRLLRPFDDDIFRRSHDPRLKEEDERLE
jgi:ATP-dependent exoDNAse (exonuclease V) alpha subunit